MKQTAERDVVRGEQPKGVCTLVKSRAVAPGQRGGKAEGRCSSSLAWRIIEPLHEGTEGSVERVSQRQGRRKEGADRVKPLGTHAPEDLTRSCLADLGVSCGFL